MTKITDAGVQEFEIRHIEAVRKLAAECTVLLRNDGVLPLKEAGKLALYGSGARRTIKGGTGSGDVNVRHFVTVEEGLAAAGFEITSGAWLDGYEEIMTAARGAWISDIKAQAAAAGANPVLFSMGMTMPEPDYELPLDAEGDTAVYVLARNSGEGNDRKPVAGDIDLSATEIRDILALNEKYEKFILVLNVGGMVNLAPVAGVKAILLLGQLGTPTGDVCADILLGKANPSGRLAMTWAPIDEYSSTEGFGDPDDTYYKEGIYVGYRYFDTVGKVPVYPFGYGLSYTTFEVTDAALALDGTDAVVTASVTNTGSCSGKEVVQIYTSAPQGELDRPYQELRAFVKTDDLPAGASQTVRARFALKDMAAYSEKASAWVLEAGDYPVLVGTNSAETVPVGVIRLDETVITEQASETFGDPGFADYVPETAAIVDAGDVPVIGAAASSLAAEPAADAENAAPAAQEESARIDWSEVKAGRKTVDEYLNGLTAQELTDLCIGNYKDLAAGDPLAVVGNASGLVAGGAGDTTQRVEGLDFLSMADGPAGLRVSKSYKIVGGEIKQMGSSLESMMEFFDQEQLAQMAVMMPKPSQEELDAPLYYQYCIAIPIGTGLAQSFNEDLCIAIGDLVGEEMELFGVNYWLAPALNIQRSPLCGRNFEYYSEDPLLSGKIAAGITKGVQRHKGCGTTIKHFAANNQETNRYTSNSAVSERAMREIYLKGFEIAVKESAPEAIMPSYNLVNGEHSCNRKDLLTTILRDEWGYQGVVMTDWLVTTGMMASPDGRYGPASAAGCVKAGNNITMPGMASDAEDILKALADETHPYALTPDDLRACAKPVLEAILRLKV